jgi:uncharacterized protein
VSPADADRLNAKLEAFDKESSNQIVVSIFPELPSPSLEDFTVRTAQAWRVGREKLDNGAVLFVFVKDRKLRIEVGYGLEGALPDALASRIIESAIVPRFRAGDPAGGLEAGVDALVAATRGEYSPPPTAAPTHGSRRESIVPFLLILLLILYLSSRGGGGRRGGGPWISGGWGGGSWGGGGSFGGGSFGGGGFSGGGGSFGGGGASGRW